MSKNTRFPLSTCPRSWELWCPLVAASPTYPFITIGPEMYSSLFSVQIFAPLKGLPAYNLFWGSSNSFNPTVPEQVSDMPYTFTILSFSLMQRSRRYSGEGPPPNRIHRNDFIALSPPSKSNILFSMVGTREIIETGYLIMVSNTNFASNVETKFTEKPNMRARNMTAKPPIWCKGKQQRN